MQQIYSEHGFESKKHSKYIKKSSVNWQVGLIITAVSLTQTKFKSLYYAYITI